MGTVTFLFTDIEGSGDVYRKLGIGPRAEFSQELGS
jgi:hypothetical protein